MAVNSISSSKQPAETPCAIKTLSTKYTFLFNALFCIAIGVTAVFYLVLNHRSFGEWSHSIIAVALTGICALLLCMVLSIELCHSKHVKNPIALMFSAFALIMGILFMFVFTPKSVPDETFHFNNAYYYANVLAGKPDTNNELTMRECDLNLIDSVSSEAFSSIVSPVNYELQKSKMFEDDSAFRDEVPYHYDSHALTMAGGTFQTRIPAAVGINLARALSLNAYQLFQLGRFFNLLFYIALLYVAIRLTPVAKPLFALVGLLPMTIHLAASYSYDVGTIGLAFLLTALLLQLIFGEGKAKTSQLMSVEIVTALLAPCKIVYCLLIGLILLIPHSRFRTHHGKTKFLFITIGMAALSIMIVQLPQLVERFASSGESPSLEIPSEAAAPVPTLGRFFTHPLESVFIIFNTLRLRANSYFITTLGGSLAYFQENIALTATALLPYLFLLVLSVQRFSAKAVQIVVEQKTVFLIICFLIFAALFLVFYLNATPNPFETFCIEGIQGRYFLPFLPLLLLVFRVKDYFFKHDFRSLLLPAMFSLNVCYLVFILASCV